MTKPTIGDFVLGLAYRYLFGEGGEEVEAKPQIPELGEIAPITKLKHKAGAVVIILGRRDSGKTITALRLAEILERPTYAISPEETPPSWVKELKLEQLENEPPPHSTLIMDDVPAYMGSRDYYNVFVQQVERIIPMVRHKRKMILVFSSQSSAQSDKYILDSDLVLLKPVNILFGDLERSSVSRLYRQVMPIYDRMSEYQQKRHIFVFSQDYKGLVRINLPSSQSH